MTFLKWLKALEIKVFSIYLMTSYSYPAQTLHFLLFKKEARSLSLHLLHILVSKGT